MRNYRRFLLAALLVVPSQIAVAQSNGSWRGEARMPTARQEMPTVAAAGRVHVFGGIASDRSTLATHEVFDPLTGQWASAAPIPRTLHHHAAASDGAVIYVTGGYSNPNFAETRVFYRYDPAGDTWTDMGELPRQVGAHASVVHGGFLYLFGGTYFNGATAASYRFDLTSQQWETLPDMPVASEHLAVAALGDHIYVVGGRRRIGFTLANSSVLMILDPGAMTWEEGPDMPSARSGLAAAATEDAIITFGGETFEDFAGVFDNVERYTPATETWDTLEPLPTGRHGLGAAALGGEIYLMGGAPVAGYGTMDDAVVFTPPVRSTGVEIPRYVEGAVSVYPNPLGGPVASVSLGAAFPNGARIEVFDVLGRKTRSLELQSANGQIDADGMPSGIYFVRAVAPQATSSAVLIRSGK